MSSVLGGVVGSAPFGVVTDAKLHDVSKADINPMNNPSYSGGGGSHSIFGAFKNLLKLGSSVLGGVMLPTKMGNSDLEYLHPLNKKDIPIVPSKVGKITKNTAVPNKSKSDKSPKDKNVKDYQEDFKDDYIDDLKDLKQKLNNVINEASNLKNEGLVNAINQSTLLNLKVQSIEALILSRSLGSINSTLYGLMGFLNFLLQSSAINSGSSQKSSEKQTKTIRETSNQDVQVLKGIENALKALELSPNVEVKPTNNFSPKFNPSFKPTFSPNVDVKPTNNFNPTISPQIDATSTNIFSPTFSPVNNFSPNNQITNNVDMPSLDDLSHLSHLSGLSDLKDLKNLADMVTIMQSENDDILERQELTKKQKEDITYKHTKKNINIAGTKINMSPADVQTMRNAQTLKKHQDDNEFEPSREDLDVLDIDISWLAGLYDKETQVEMMDKALKLSKRKK